MSENIQQDRTDIWMRPTPQQTDTLTTGSERLAQSLKDEGLPVDMTDCWAEFIKADPGIVAFTELPTYRKFILHADGTRTEYVPIEAVHRAIKKWETGT